MGSNSPQTSYTPASFANRKLSLQEKLRGTKELSVDQISAYEKALDSAFLKDSSANDMSNLNAFEVGFDTNLKDLTEKNDASRRALQEQFNTQRSSNAALSDPAKKVSAYVGATNAKNALTNTLTGK